MFYERLQKCCERAGIKITTLASVFNTSKGTINGWRTGKSPNSEFVTEAAKYFSVSADYLLGLTDDPSPVKSDMRNLEEDEALLIDRLRQAAPPVKAMVLRMADAVLSMPPAPTTIQLGGPSFLAVNDDRFRPQGTVKAGRGLKRVEGDAAAGPPITAVPEDDLVASVPVKYMSSNYFIVRARGDSMINADIADGDFCVFQKDGHLDEGRIMLVQVEGTDDEPDVTIKRVFFRGKQIELRSENPAYPPMFYPAETVSLMGILVTTVTPDA